MKHLLGRVRSWMNSRKRPVQIIEGPPVTWGRKKHWPVNWPIRMEPEDRVVHLESMVREYRQMAARTEFINNSSYKLACREARLQRYVADRAHTALTRIALLADERHDHELHVMAMQGVTCAQDRETVWRSYEHEDRVPTPEET